MRKSMIISLWVSIIVMILTPTFVSASDGTKKLTVVYTNDTLGTLEICKCNSGGLGGLARRATVIKKLIADHPTCMVLESGDLTAISGQLDAAANLRQIASVLKSMSYAAVGVGPIDVQLGEAYFTVLRDAGVQVVQVEQSDHVGTVPYLIKDSGGIRVGIVSFGAVKPEQRDNFDLLKMRYKTLREVRSKCDVLVLLDQAGVATEEWLERNAKKLGCPDIVVGGTAWVSLNEPKLVGSTMIVPTSVRGAYVGQVDIEMHDGKTKMNWSRIPLERSILDDKEVVKILNTATTER